MAGIFFDGPIFLNIACGVGLVTIMFLGGAALVKAYDAFQTMRRYAKCWEAYSVTFRQAMREGKSIDDASTEARAAADRVRIY